MVSEAQPSPEKNQAEEVTTRGAIHKQKWIPSAILLLGAFLLLSCFAGLWQYNERFSSLFRGFAMEKSSVFYALTGAIQAPRLDDETGLQVIKRSAIELRTENFERAHKELVRLTQEKHGFVTNLRVTGVRQEGRSLDATIRVPVEDLEWLSNQMKSLGRLERDTLITEESEEDPAHIAAELANARSTQARLEKIVNERSGKAGEFLEVEKELARLRGETVDLDARRRKVLGRIQWAVLQVVIIEEMALRLEVDLAGAWVLVRDAGIDGVRMLVQGSATVLSFLFRFGPVIILWFGMVLWLVRWLWRRYRILSPILP